MSYCEARDFLAGHTRTHELSAGGARVAVCPAWQGRVMTSTCGGETGPSFGFINRPFIEAGQPDARFNNYGGEDRFWLSPEGGPFSLWFAPGVEQVFDNWYTQAMLNEGAWSVAGANQRQVRMHVDMSFRNTADTHFELGVDRDVRLLSANQYTELFGAEAARLITDQTVAQVGYETANRVTNRGAPMRKSSGLVSIWILGMLGASEKTVVIAPYKSGPVDERGPVVKSDYFGPIPADRLKITPDAVLLRADADDRGKLGLSPQRAKPVVGSIDFDAGVLTLVHFTMPDNPADALYLNNQWGEQDDPFTGDAMNAYNDGPNASGSQLGEFYEIESLSPAEALATGQSIEHCHRTIHIQGEPDMLRPIAHEVLGVDLDEVSRQMFG